MTYSLLSLAHGMFRLASFLVNSMVLKRMNARFEKFWDHIQFKFIDEWSKALCLGKDFSYRLGWQHRSPIAFFDQSYFINIVVIHGLRFVPHYQTSWPKAWTAALGTFQVHPRYVIWCIFDQCHAYLVHRFLKFGAFHALLHLSF